MSGKQVKTQQQTEKGESESLRLGQLRLLIALDALLVEGSVGGAAKQMGLSIAAMSRLLGQIREKFNDPILVRSGPKHGGYTKSRSAPWASAAVGE